MAAGEEQAKLVRALHQRVGRPSRPGRLVEKAHRGAFASRSRRLAPYPVERFSPRDRCQPRAGIVGYARGAPLFERDNRRFLYGIFGEIEIAGQTDEGGHHAATLPSNALGE